jgi:acetyltransferase-like isoleucine patch superfamily enzyme
MGTGKALRTYLRAYDKVVFYARCARGYARSKFSAGTFGPFPVLLGRVRLRIRGQATFGARLMVEAPDWDVTVSVAEGATLTVGDGVYVNDGTSIEVWHDVRIGSNVLLAPFVSIIDTDRHEVEPGTPLFKGPTVIGDRVWLGRNVTVLPGVTVGSGSVIGAHSVVSRDIPPCVFAAGSPARVIKPLDLPDNWDHRYGYGAMVKPAGPWAALRRRLDRSVANGRGGRRAVGAHRRERVSSREA